MNPDLIEAEKICLSSLEKWSTIEEKIWMQKSRANWIQLGDSNTKFFHAYAKERRCQNNIKFLITEDGTRIDKHNLIKEEIRGFYLKLMGSSVDSLPMVDKNVVKRGPMLSQHQQDLLCSKFTAVEVKNVLFSMDSSKAPGIDGYNVHFFKCSWNIIGDSVIDAILDFFKTGFMPKIINCTYMTLLPKEVNVTSVKNFRPIACCSVIYKIISKILTSRMQGVLNSVVSENQSAFVKGRVIFDNIILSHELVKSYSRKGISPRCMVKIDLQKAYNSVEWPFIKHLMLELGFSYKFVNWVMGCLTTASYTFNINGDLTRPFAAKKGLRQGDPISPYLFVICMEYLNICLIQLRKNAAFRFHPRCKRLNLIHVCFVDDLLLFSRGDVDSVSQLFEAFSLFSAASEP
uniref:RNA-directed DNA polymerase (Reverse transcriptase) n=1 Tax=Medicago truncatula TaxID=3880 RepID=Q2HRL2_MEDTR|nr:RNA-directed DNA polymerase (Reverse transcriptase) [Medicago truncatula]